MRPRHRTEAPHSRLAKAAHSRGLRPSGRKGPAWYARCVADLIGTRSRARGCDRFVVHTHGAIAAPVLEALQAPRPPSLRLPLLCLSLPPKLAVRCVPCTAYGLRRPADCACRRTGAARLRQGAVAGSRCSRAPRAPRPSTP
jgi:hypothetical protein